MSDFNLRPDYDPNIMPHQQGASEIEENLIKKVATLYKQETRVLLCGSRYRVVSAKELQDRKQIFQEKSNPSMLRYREAGGFYPEYDHEENIQSFEKLKKRLQCTEDGSYLWAIDELARNPYKALQSWHQVYENAFKTPSTVSLEEYFSFCESTIYLLCLCVPNASGDPRFNPMQIQQYLCDSLWHTQVAFLNLMDAYPPVSRSSTYKKTGGVCVTRKSEFLISDPVLHTEVVWYLPPKILINRMKSLFKKHLKQAGIQMDHDDFESLMKNISDLVMCNNKVNYLFPFVCTKLFAELLCYKSNSQGKENSPLCLGKHQISMIKDELYNYEVVERLIDRHQRKILDDSIFLSNQENHPVIAFMQDAVSLIYEIGMLEAQEPEHLIMDQINTNWLTLCLFGTRRYFSDPNICLQFCDLTLPILLQGLFEDKESRGKKRLDKEWLYRLAKCQPLEFEDATWKNLNKAGVFEFEEMLTSIAWKNQLANYVFNPSLWNESGLTEQSSEFQKEIDDIAQKISVAADILRERNEAAELAVPAIRNALLFHLVDPILDDLLEFLEILSTPEKQWRLAYMK